MEKRNTFSPLFFIKKHRAKSNGEVPIYLRITINGQSLDMSMHREVIASKWDNRTGVVIGNSREAKLINSYLFSVKSSIYEHYKYLRETDDELTPTRVKNSYLGIAEEKRKSIVEIFTEHNDEIKKLEGKGYTSITIRRYKTSLSRLKAFIKFKYDKVDMYLDDLNHSFVKAYEVYIKSTTGVCHNTSIKFLKQLKKIVGIAIANGWMTVDPFRKIKLREEKVDRGYLSDADIKALIALKFDFKRLEEVRDCFIFSCFTGLAFTDAKSISPENIVIGSDGGQWIKINRAKNNNLSSVPILPPIQRIIDKYKDDTYCKAKNVLIPVKSNQKMNAYLKEIATLAGIKLNLTTHLARHTFATTVTLNNDVPIETVSKMLGHTSLKTTKIYARLLDKKVGRDMNKISSLYST